MFENIGEDEQLDLFRAAYELVTGQHLRRVRKSERPDYICRRPDGSLVGVEFTMITRDPEASSAAQILDNVDHMDGCDAVQAVGEAVMKKGAKRAEPTWQLPHSSILVISTPDCPISDIQPHLDEGLQAEFQESGFTEVWISDHTDVEAYGTVELFGLVPKKWWGYHPRPWTGNPYG